MLIGTLVTIAGFVPIGFAQSSAGEYTFSIFAVVAIALIVSWLVAVLFAPIMGAAILRPPKEEAKDPDPGVVLRTYKKNFWIGRSPTVGSPFSERLRCSCWRSGGCGSCRNSFSRPRIEPNFSSISPFRRIRPSAPAKTLRQSWTMSLPRTPMSAAGARMWAAGAIRFYLPLNVQQPNDFFAQQVIVAKDLAGRRRLQAKIEQLLGRVSKSGNARLSAGARAGGRLARAVSPCGSRRRPSARSIDRGRGLDCGTPSNPPGEF